MRSWAATLLVALTVATFVSPMVRPAAGSYAVEGRTNGQNHAPLSGVLGASASEMTQPGRVAADDSPGIPAPSPVVLLLLAGPTWVAFRRATPNRPAHRAVGSGGSRAPPACSTLI